MFKYLLKSASIYGFSDLLKKVSPFILLPLYLSNLSVSEFGKLEYITIISTLSCFIIGWGSTQGVMRFYVEDGAKAVLSAILIIFSITFFLLVFLEVISCLIDIYDLAGLRDENQFYIIVAFAFLFSINNLSLSLLRIQERLKEFALFNLISTFLQVVSISLALLVTNLGYLSKIYGLLFSNFLLSVLLIIFVLRQNIYLNFWGLSLRKYIRFFSPVAFNNLLGWANASFDKVVIKAVAGDEALGTYALAIQLVQIFKLGIESFMKTINVALYKHKNMYDIVIKNRIMVYSLLCVFGLLYYIAIVTLSNSDFFNGYTISSSVLLLLILSRVFLLMNYVESILYYTKLNSIKVLKSTMLSLVLTLSIIYPSVYYFGALGASTTLVVTSITAHLYLISSHYNNYFSLAYGGGVLISSVVCLYLFVGLIY